MPEASHTAEGEKDRPPLPEPLLRTKLFTPPLPPNYVPRPHLVGQLQRGLDRALVLLSAPAGFGKSSLLAEWAAQAQVPVAWLSLDSGDNDPRRFLAYFLAALDSALGSAGDPCCATTHSMLQSVQPFPLQSLLIALLNDVAAFDSSFAVVLDDFQFITNREVNEAVAFIVERKPPCMRLVIAARVDPSLPLHRLRASQQLLEVRSDELRFSTGEVAAFLDQGTALNLSGEDIATLAARTEGWMVGLQMAAISLRDVADPSAFIRDIGGSQRYILEYLIEEVLNRQPAGLRDFLLQTSILERLCGPLCDALLDEQQDSQSVLNHLERANLFLTPLDDTGYWYRYHHLFADLLRLQLKQAWPEKIPGLHKRASQWYEAEGDPASAIQHAFSGHDLERASQLIERAAMQILSRGEMSTLLGYLQALPETLLWQHPGLCVQYAWALTFSGQLEAVETWLQRSEAQISPTDASIETQEIRGGIAIIRALVCDIRGEMAPAIELARQADELLPGDNLMARSVVPFVLGDGYLATGNLEQAERAYEQIHRIGQASGNLWTISIALHKLALLKKLQGQLHRADALYQEAMQLAGRRGGLQFGSLGAFQIGWADILREWNELETARKLVDQALDNMAHWPSPTDQLNGYLTLARIDLAEGQTESAAGALQQAEALSRRAGVFAITLVSLETCQVRLWLAQANQAALARWMKSKPLSEVEETDTQAIDYIQELEHITLARVLIAQGQSDRAAKRLEALASAAETAGRMGRLIEILVLLALARQASGETQRAVAALERGVRLAEPEGYQRIFLDEGAPIARLLTQLIEAQIPERVTSYAARLLSVFPEAPEPLLVRPDETGKSPPHPEATELVEPLSPRELEVLALICAGYSNQDIAGELYISINTVKRHNNSIYSKLGVTNRAQAIVLAQKLGLLGN